MWRSPAIVRRLVQKDLFNAHTDAAQEKENHCVSKKVADTDSHPFEKIFSRSRGRITNSVAFAEKEKKRGAGRRVALTFAKEKEESVSSGGISVPKSQKEEGFPNGIAKPFATSEKEGFANAGRIRNTGRNSH